MHTSISATSRSASKLSCILFCSEIFHTFSSSDKYCEVLKSVEKYIHGRWDPWREVVKNETKNLVTEVCEVYTISEKSLGDIVDRKMSQVRDSQLKPGCCA
jgi:hypothetical protein